MKNSIVLPGTNIRQAMKQLSRSGEKCLVITDENNYLLGTLSDGDIRKAILNGVSVGSAIETIFRKNPTVLIDGKYSLSEAKNKFLKYNFDLIPVVDKKGILADILFFRSVFSNLDTRKKKKLNVPVVIMSGGRGSRLEPFTKVLPKPLVPVNEKPIIEHIIERFTYAGCNEFYLTVNYKSSILKAYFQELNYDYNLDFIEEQKPLGTAGSLRLFKNKLNSPFFVTNCDIILKTDYEVLYEFHQKHGFDVTLVASTKEFVIPYGTCEINGEGQLSHINEKPKYEFLVNTGLYVLNPHIVNIIPKNKFYHLTHLIENAKEQGYKVGVYPIDDDSWVDIGQWAEYRKALGRL